MDGGPGSLSEMFSALAAAVPHLPDCAICPCRACKMTEEIVLYMFTGMEPTDRALRPAGNIAPVPSPEDASGS